MNELSKRAKRFSGLLGVSALCVVGAILRFSSTPVAHAAGAAPAQLPLTAEQSAFFEKNVRPVLAESCYGCHSAATKAAGGLRVDDRDALLKGGKDGPAIVPGDAANSLLLKRLILPDNDTHRMPKGDDPLAKAVVANLTAWINDGAPWPAPSAEAAVANAETRAVVAKATTDLQAIGAVKAKETPEQVAYFQKEVKPILVKHCYTCHSDAFKAAGGLRLDTTIGIETGGNAGPAVIAGEPDASPLLKRILVANPKRRMPKDSPALSDNEIATLRTWIKNGAALPDESEKPPALSAKLARTYEKERADHWAFQPLTHPQVPRMTGKGAGWATSDIDRFVLASLNEKEMTPVGDVGPEALIRRVTYDLIGLPPTPAAVAAFRRHHSERDYARLVDNLLASPQYGERWGRHWLDIARYAESSGPSRNMPYPHAWKYRDYVIESVNKDIPYNRFIQEQIAGDLLPADTDAERDRLRTATGFLALGVKDVNQRFPARYIMDNADDQIDTVARSTMALTVTCARCHDHKFDPVPSTDYYALAGIFTSTDDAVGLRSQMGGAGLAYYVPKNLLLSSAARKAPKAPEEQLKELDAKIAENTKTVQALTQGGAGDPDAALALPKATKKKIAATQKANFELRKMKLDLADPGTLGYGIHGAREGRIADTAIRIRGIEERHGPAIPRGFLTAFEVPGAKPVNPKQSGRLELAEWITNTNNPLSARVAVNRVWFHLFGTGLVSTVDNFGIMGDKPSNAALLDYLANDFIQKGWSTKKLIREIVLTHAYRLGSDYPPQYKEKDPGNRLVWRHSPRRLEAEEIRDSMLASSGKLDLTPAKGSPTMKLKMVELADNSDTAKALYEEADRSTHRSIYLPLLRGITPRPLAAFDPVSQTLVSGQRDVTVVPTQALFMLNSIFVQEQALALADNLETVHRNDTRAQIAAAYQRIYGRDPNKQELAKDMKFLVQYGKTYRKIAAQKPPEGDSKV